MVLICNTFLTFPSEIKQIWYRKVKLGSPTAGVWTAWSIGLLKGKRELCLGERERGISRAKSHAVSKKLSSGSDAEPPPTVATTYIKELIVLAGTCTTHLSKLTYSQNAGDFER